MVTGKPPDELIDRKVPHGIGPATSARDAGGGDIIADLRSAVVLYLVDPSIRRRRSEGRPWSELTLA